MNREDTTKFLGDLLVSDRFGGMGKYYAREVSIDYGTKDVKRVDFMQFEPAGVTSISSIEKGTFTCYEVKSCKEDVFSGKLDAHIEDRCPNSSHYYGIMVAIPQYAEEVDEYENPTPLEPGDRWKLAVILPCRQGPRRRSLTEMLFYMLRSGR